MRDARKIAVLGAGTMGRGLARLFASGGWRVLLVDPMPGALDHAPEHPSIGMASAMIVGGAYDAVIEFVPEKVDIKREVIAQAERCCGEGVPILSNTSGLAIADLTCDMKNPERFFITHFSYPADIFPAVEVVPHPDADAALTTKIVEWLGALGKKPSVLKKEVPGFVANRIQHAIARECFALIENGVVSATELNDIVRWSIGVRLAVHGPMKQRDLNGLDTHLSIATYLYPDLENGSEPSRILADKVANGQLGRKTGQGFYSWPENGDDDQTTEVLKHVINASTKVQ